MHRIPGIVLLFAIAVSTAGCEYARMLRPSVLKQLNPRVVRLVNYLPNVDDPNEAMVGRLFAHGGLSHAELGKDGVFRDVVRVPEGEYMWYPSVIVMERGGELELDFYNEDPYAPHAATLPNAHEKHMLVLPINSRGRARIRLDQPGYYFFGCPVGNHAGRGMLGLVIVEGDVPAAARLDRPAQKRP